MTSYALSLCERILGGVDGDTPRPITTRIIPATTHPYQPARGLVRYKG